MRKKMIILPKLNDCTGDLKKKWFVYFSVRNPASDKMQRFKIYGKLSAFKDAEKRTRAGELLCNEYVQKLKHGWSPFTDDSKVIYDDHLEYDKITRIYGRQRAANKTIKYYANKFLETLIGHIDKDGTLPTYKSKMRIFCMWVDAQHMGENDATSINNDNVVAFFRWLIDDQKRSRKTVGTYRQILQSFFEWLVKEKVYVSNPVHDLPNTDTLNDQSPAPIHGADVSIFKEALKHDPQLSLAVQFQYYCALRPGKELRLLKIKNIDFARNLVTILRTEAKKGITRTVVIPECFMEELRNEYQLHKYDREYFVFGKNGEPGPDNLGKNNMRFRFNKVRELLGMPIEYKFYSWKHTGAVQASLSGIPDKHIQMQMGHTSLATTEKYLRKMVGHQSDFLKNKYPEF